MAENYINMFAEKQLSRLLSLWLAPAVPRNLDQRITHSFLFHSKYQLGFASPRRTSTRTEVSMKRCNACDEYEFKVTMISNAGLGRRLVAEISFVIDRLRRGWPNFKRDPIASSARAIHKSTTQLKTFVLAPHALASALTAILLVLSAVMLVILLGRMPKDHT